MNDENGHDSPGRLDRIEGIIEALASRQHLIEDEFARLLRAQVVMAGHMENLTSKLEKLTSNVTGLTTAQQRIDQNLAEATDKLNGLIGAVDSMRRDFHERIHRLESQEPRS